MDREQEGKGRWRDANPPARKGERGTGGFLIPTFLLYSTLMAEPSKAEALLFYLLALIVFFFILACFLVSVGNFLYSGYLLLTS